MPGNIRSKNTETGGIRTVGTRKMTTNTKMNTFLDFIDPTAKNGNWKGSDTIWATENTTWTDGKTNGVMKEGTDADGTEKEIVGVAQIGTKANTVIYVVYLKAKT
jgi:hypothetical protein